MKGNKRLPTSPNVLMKVIDERQTRSSNVLIKGHKVRPTLANVLMKGNKERPISAHVLMKGNKERPTTTNVRVIGNK